VTALPLVKYPAAILASISTRESGGKRCSDREEGKFKENPIEKCYMIQTWNIVSLMDGDA
jgi:hypothetical protein